MKVVSKNSKEVKAVKTVGWKPTAGNIVIIPMKEADKTAGGLIVPEAFRKLTNIAEVIEVAEGTDEHPKLYKAGDIVMIPNPLGLPFEENGETYMVMSQYDIRAYRSEV